MIPARESLGESVLWAIVHNAATWRRNLELRIRWPIPRAVQGRPSAVVVRPGAEPMPIRAEDRIMLPRMEPLENRWVGVRVRGLAGRRGLVAAIEFDEMVGDAAVNGFALGVQLAADRKVARHAWERLRSVETRLLSGWSADIGDAIQGLPGDRPLKFPDVAALAGRIAELSLGRGKDQFGIEEAFGAFKRVAKREGPARFVALTSLMEIVDAHLTSQRLGAGTRADILQTVRWELEVLEEARGAADNAALARIAARCRQFIADWEARNANPSDAVGLVRETLEPMSALGDRTTQRNLLRLGEACLAASKDLDLFQGKYAVLVRALALALAPRKRR
jgi:hypothetical protein